MCAGCWDGAWAGGWLRGRRRGRRLTQQVEDAGGVPEVGAGREDAFFDELGGDLAQAEAGGAEGVGAGDGGALVAGELARALAGVLFRG